MPALKHISIGEPAHDAERQAIRFLVDGLDENYVVYSNPWIVDRSGATYEVDAVVVCHHAIFVVEMKAYRGRIEGNDHDWFIPEPIRSPVKLNEKKAKILSSELKRKDYAAGKAWVDHVMFLSHTNDVKLDGMVAQKHVHTRTTILDVIRGRIETSRRSHAAEVDGATAETLHRLLTGVSSSTKPKRRMREYELQGTLDQSARHVDYRAVHTLTKQRCGLRVYAVDPLADEAERDKQLRRITWEAQVLGRIGAHPNVLRMETPQTDEDRQHVFVPFELVHGVTLESWIERHRSQLRRNEGVSQIVGTWLKMVAAIRHAHKQGVVHRMLRPEVVLVKDFAEDPDVKVTGFDLAKRLDTSGTIHFSSVGDERMTFAAPEVLANWSDASAASDQFGLGVLLAWMLTGSPLFESTRVYQRKRGVCPRLRDRNHFVSKTLDEAVRKMLMLRPADRYENLDAAAKAIKKASGHGGRSAAPPLRLDPEQLEPGTRLPTEHEIRSRLGEGGYGVVYLARHLVSGDDHAIKVARRSDDLDTEEPLRAEERVLKALHDRGAAPGIVKPVMLTRIEGQLALIMERVPGDPMSTWLPEHPEPESGQLRAMAEDLFGALMHLEKTDIDGMPVIHKDLKPDNMIVSDKGLTLIDFSMATTVDPNSGSALYRDPNQAEWSHASDRYAAAICLYELYTGRHPFGREAPAPDQQPDVDAGDFDQPGLPEFFRQALDPSQARRHPSATAMRVAFVQALGETQADEAPAKLDSDHASEPLSATSLDPAIVACLRRAGVSSQGELMGLSERQIRGISGLGKKKARKVLQLRRKLEEAGVQAPSEVAPRHVLWPGLVGDPTELGRAGFPRVLVEVLAAAGLGTVGRVADATGDELRKVPRVGAKAVGDVVDHLALFAERARPSADGAPQNPEALWRLASKGLSATQGDILRAVFGFDVPGSSQVTQGAVADRLELDQSRVSALQNEALEHLHLPALDEAYQSIEVRLDAGGGVLAMHQAADAVLESLPATRALLESGDAGSSDSDPVDPLTRAVAEGMVRLLVRVHQAQMCLTSIQDELLEVIYRPSFDAASIERFVRRARELAAWPPAKPGSDARLLGRELPGFDQQRHSPLALAEHLLGDVRLTDVGELFQTPVDAKPALEYMLDRKRLPIGLDELREAMSRAFGEFAHMPDDSHLPEVIASLGLGVLLEAGVVTAKNQSAETDAPLEGDPLPEVFRHSQKTPADVVRDSLCSAAGRGGWRLVVTPPERHAAIGPDLATSLESCAAARYVSLEQAFFEAVEPDFATYERASRFSAQRRRLSKKLEEVLDALVAEHSKPGNIVVLGDTALLHTCGATHLVRKLYDQTHGGSKGLWVMVVPGVIKDTQPRFLEGEAVFGLAGQVLPFGGDASLAPLMDGI